MEPSAVLSIRGLSKRYGGRRGVQANDGIDLDVLPGQVVGLLGHNGAGKTTLVNQVVGLVRPDAGAITLGGIDAVAHPHIARQRTSIQAQANVPITGLTPRTAIQLARSNSSGASAAAGGATSLPVRRRSSTPSTSPAGRTPRPRRSPAAWRDSRRSA